MLKYLANCFLLFIPVFIWNAVFFKQLPKGYTTPKIWGNIPAWVNISEQILRTIVFLLPLILKFSLKTQSQKMGMYIYIIGIIIYFTSWLWQIYLPNSSWSRSLLGFMAPSYSPMILLIGVGIIGKQAFINIPRITFIYLSLAIAFILVHSFHAFLVYKNL